MKKTMKKAPGTVVIFLILLEYLASFIDFFNCPHCKYKF